MKNNNNSNNNSIEDAIKQNLRNEDEGYQELRRSNSIPVVLEHKIEIVEEQVLESPVRK